MSTNAIDYIIREVDPQGTDALALLRESAVEARELYPEFQRSDAPWPTNSPTVPRGIYLVAYQNGSPVACGALRPLDETAAEIRRLFVVRHMRRRGVGRALLAALEAAAAGFGYRLMRLETGNRQLAATGLYDAYGFVRIEPFGEHVGDPTSVCYEKAVRIHVE
jgi:putative acetyltransferase